MRQKTRLGRKGRRRKRWKRTILSTAASHRRLVRGSSLSPFAYDTVGGKTCFLSLYVVPENGEIEGNAENGELDRVCAQTTNEDLFNTFFQRLSLQEGDGPSPLEERRYDEACGDAVSDSDNGAETRRKRTSMDTERYQLTQYAGSVRLMSNVNFSEFLKR